MGRISVRKKTELFCCRLNRFHPHPTKASTCQLRWERKGNVHMGGGGAGCEPHCTKIRNIYSQKWNCMALFPISTFMYLEATYMYIPTIGHIWNLYFPVLLERILGSAAGMKRRVRNCRQAELGDSSLPSPPLLQLSREFTYDQNTIPIWKIMNHKWKQLILVVNFLLGLRVNEILNKTFISDSRRPFIFSAQSTSVSFPPS